MLGSHWNSYWASYYRVCCFYLLFGELMVWKIFSLNFIDCVFIISRYFGNYEFLYIREYYFYQIYLINFWIKVLMGLGLKHNINIWIIKWVINNETSWLFLNYSNVSKFLLTIKHFLACILFISPLPLYHMLLYSSGLILPILVIFLLTSRSTTSLFWSILSSNCRKFTQMA